MTHPIRIILFIILSTWILFPLHGHADDTGKVITFSTPLTKQENGFAWQETLYTEAFRRLGYYFKLEPVPVKRSLKDANDGVTDGDPSRIFDLNKDGRYPNLIRVDETIGEAYVAAYTRREDLSFDGWESLSTIKGIKLRIGYTRGFIAVENNLHEYTGSEHTVAPTQHPAHSIRMLAAGRYDLILDPKKLADTVLALAEFRDSGIKCVGILETVKTYPYLNRKHAALAPILARTLREMKEDGSFDQITQSGLKLPQAP